MIGKKQKEKNLSVYLREHGREKRKKRLLRNFIFIILAIFFASPLVPSCLIKNLSPVPVCIGFPQILNLVKNQAELNDLKIIGGVFWKVQNDVIVKGLAPLFPFTLEKTLFCFLLKNSSNTFWEARTC